MSRHRRGEGNRDARSSASRLKFKFRLLLLWLSLLSIAFDIRSFRCYFYISCVIYVYIYLERGVDCSGNVVRKKNMEILDFYLLDVEEEKIRDKQIISTLHFLDISEWCCIEIRRRKKKDGGPKRLSPRPDKTLPPKGCASHFTPTFLPSESWTLEGAVKESYLRSRSEKRE